MKLKKTLTTAMALITACACLAGCGQKEEAPPARQDTVRETARKEETSEAQAGTEQAKSSKEAEKPVGEGVYGGTFRAVSGAEPNVLDPHYCTTSGEFIPMWHIFETPVSMDADGNYHPLVCDYEMSEDGKVLTLTVREGVTFHDGTEVTSRDIQASINRWMKGRASRQSGFGKVLESQKIVDDRTVEYTFSKTAPMALYLLSQMDYGAHILKADFLESLGEGAMIQGYEPDNYIGTGAYKFVEWIPKQYIKTARYDGYCPVDSSASGAAGTRYAYADEIKFMIMTDDATIAMNMMTGDLDYANFSEELAGPLLEDKVIYEHMVNMGASVVFVFNNSEDRPDSFIHDINFRKAILAALDMKAVMLSFVPEKRIVMSPTMVKDGTLYDNDEIARDVWNVHDTELAKKYLAESGYNGEEIIWVTRSSTVNYKPSVVAAEQLGEVGINVKIISVETTASKAYQEDYTGWDVACIMSPTLKEDACNYTPIQPGYWVKWESEEKAELFDKMMSTSDTKLRQEYLDRMTEILYYEELPFLICGSRLNTYYLRAGVEGPYGGTNAYFWNSWLTDGQ